MKNRKLYLARFTQKESGDQFYKIGQCWQYDADERFLFDPAQYYNYDIKIMASAWGPADQVDEWEQNLLDIKPKDFWIKEKFSGVTELRRYNGLELTNIFNILKDLRSRWYEQRQQSKISA
jgi:hypothetical protein